MGQMTPTEDSVLVERTLQGNMQAYEGLIERYKHMVFTLAVKMMRNREEAEELAQDTFLKAYRGLKSYQGGAKFSTWLYKITYNTCLDQLKKNKRNPEATTLNDRVLEKQWVSGGILENLDCADRKYRIGVAINKLSEEDAAIITMYYFDEMTLGEISEVVDLSTDVVKVRLFRSRKQLASLLRPVLEQEKN
jgi:RNA polymerase sigma-70 factor (ECF subfamily)